MYSIIRVSCVATCGHFRLTFNYGSNHPKFFSSYIYKMQTVFLVARWPLFLGGWPGGHFFWGGGQVATFFGGVARWPLFLGGGQVATFFGGWPGGHFFWGVARWPLFPSREGLIIGISRNKSFRETKKVRYFSRQPTPSLLSTTFSLSTPFLLTERDDVV